MKLQPLSPALGVEAKGLYLSAPLKASDVAELRRALDESHLILFRGQPVSLELQFQLCEAFGTIIDERATGKKWFMMTNRERGGGRGRLLYHADFSFTRTPVAGSSLYAVEIPSYGTSTSFTNAVRAWHRLPASLREELDSLASCHANYATVDYEGTSARRMQAPPTYSAVHPIHLKHPRTGASILYVNELATLRIEGFESARSEALLDRVFSHLYVAENQYEHQWQIDDLVIWDNFAVQHARHDEARGEPRSLRKVSFIDQTNAAEADAFYQAFTHRKRSVMDVGAAAQ